MGLVIWWLVDYLRGKHSIPPSLRTARVPLVLLLGWATYLLVQAIPMPGPILKLLSPATYELYAYASGEEVITTGALSIDRGATLVEFLKGITYTGIFFLTLVLVFDRHRLRLLATVLILVGATEALAGIVFGLTDQIPFIPEFDQHGVNWASGTYVNSNHFAGLMEMTIAMGLGLILSRTTLPGGTTDWKRRLYRLSGFIMDVHFRRYFYVMLMFSALTFSSSRGGISAWLAAFTVVVLIAMGVRGRHSREGRLAPWAVFLAVIAVLWLGYSDLQEKMERSGLHSDRHIIRENAYPMVADRPLFGSGAGTFRYLFPLYKDQRLARRYYDHAHNDYLETLTDQGLVGFGLLGLALAFMIARNIGAFVRRHHPFMRGILFGSLVGTLALLFHGWVDFNLQIPANAAYFFVLLGMGTIAANLDSRGKHKT